MRDDEFEGKRTNLQTPSYNALLRTKPCFLQPNLIMLAPPENVFSPTVLLSFEPPLPPYQTENLGVPFLPFDPWPKLLLQAQAHIRSTFSHANRVLSFQDFRSSAGRSALAFASFSGTSDTGHASHVCCPSADTGARNSSCFDARVGVVCADTCIRGDAVSTTTQCAFESSDTLTKGFVFLLHNLKLST